MSTSTLPSKTADGAGATLIERLRSVMSPDRVTDDSSTLDAFSHDAWPVAILQSQLGQHITRPDIVVSPTSIEEICGVLELARESGTPVTPRGLGSSVTGQSLPTRGGIVLDLSQLLGEPQLDDINMTVTAPAGVRGSDLECWLGERGMTMNFFPQSLDRSSIGGWIATRATGQLSSRYGGIEEACVGYTVVLSDGSVIKLGQKPRASVGPDLRELFLGSEGMFGIVTDVSLKVYSLPQTAISEAWTLPSVSAGLAIMREIFQSGLRPSLMRLYDESEARHALPNRSVEGCAIFLTHEGLTSVATAEHSESARIVEAHGGYSLGPDPVNAWYDRRFDFSEVEKLLASEGGYAETIEVAHLWSGIENLYDRLTVALAPMADEVLGHFSHVYLQGISLYVILLGRADTNEEAARRLTEIWRVAMETTMQSGGELSHHHGAGLARQEFIPQSLGNKHQLIRRLKSALDEPRILNPGHLGL